LARRVLLVWVLALDRLFKRAILVMASRLDWRLSLAGKSLVELPEDQVLPMRL
jgi:hypothetical protein